MKTIVLSGPGKNALSTPLMEHLIAEVRSAGDAPLLFKGANDVFSAGLNLKEVAELDVAGMARFLGLLEEAVQLLFEHPAPTAAWVNGHAIAGGCVMALCCDVRVMTGRAGARMGLNEVALGVHFPPRTMAMLRKRLPGPALAQVALGAQLHDAAAAKALGLVDAVGEEDAAVARLEALAAHPRAAYAATKRAVFGSVAVTDAEQREFLEKSVPVWASEDLKAQLRAALKK